jgi:FKBP-type peptidyl-prolyl cis-trans isomerase FkpA
MRLVVVLIITIIVFSCSGDMKKQQPIDMNQMQEDLLKANKNAVALESEQIDKYIEEKKLDVITTKTGLRYNLYQDIDGDLIVKNQKAVVKYAVTLLDGTECYSTKDEVEEFTVGKDYVESGLHEGITFMGVGDKAIIIIPSHLAHGLAGDMKKIPFRSTIIYDIELVAIK